MVYPLYAGPSNKWKSMGKAVMIFNGLHFYFPVAERAFNWAKQSNGSVVALFLRAGHEAKKGYFFPSDLGAAENLATNEDADADNTKVIESNIRLLKHQAINEHAELVVQLVSNPSEEELLLQLNSCEIIFMQGYANEHENLPVDGIDTEKLLKNITIPIEIIQ